MKLTSGNVFPDPPRNDGFDSRFGQAENVLKLTSCRPISIKLSHRPNFLIGHFVSWGKFPMGMPCAPLVNHVLHVVQMSPEKKVVRVATRWIVAFVKYLKSIWNRAVVLNPHRPVGRNNRILSGDTNHAVTALVDGGRPRPTPVPLHLDFLKKTVSEWTRMCRKSHGGSTTASFAIKCHRIIYQVPRT